MVPLNQAIALENSLKNSPKAYALYCYMNGASIVVPEELNENEQIYYGAIKALEKNDGAAFKSLYEDLAKRKVSKDQPIVYNNFLLFLLIIGTTKFNVDNGWLKATLKLRDTINEPEKSISISLNDLLNENYHTTDGITSVILAGLSKANSNQVDESIVRNSLIANSKIISFLEKDLFLVAIFKFTSDYIISISIGNESIRLKNFERVFLKRVTIIQNIIYVVIIALIILMWFYLTDKYPKIKPVANDLASILGIIGFGLLASLLYMVRNRIGWLIRRIFGHQ